MGKDLLIVSAEMRDEVCGNLGHVRFKLELLSTFSHARFIVEDEVSNVVNLGDRLLLLVLLTFASLDGRIVEARTRSLMVGWAQEMQNAAPMKLFRQTYHPL
jgi:hypothetical protein